MAQLVHRTLKVKEAQEQPLAKVLKEYVREGELYRRLDGDKVECYACGHRCVIYDGLPGVCRVRYNEGGRLMVPWGYAGALHLDPIEKKPFFHAYPGARALSFGMLGCDLKCPYCQNWQISQVLRDSVATALADFTPMAPEQFIGLARRHRAKVLTSTYNEPLITSEWAVALFKEGKKYGLVGSYVSNGNATPEVLDYIRPFVDLYKIDLKSMNDRNYRVLGGKLETVLNTIRWTWERKFWVEVVTLVVPNFNDSEEELREAARYIASISPDIPWHVTAFHPDYQMTDHRGTPARTLIRAAEIGKEEGLKFVYAGNLPGMVREFENTYCPNCQELLIERYGFRVTRYRLQGDRCPACQTVIPGVWWREEEKPTGWAV
ncbi:MAG: AmmeMemoRadiSam system radical SAM enzyme [Armatimonadetes bacterium]|nr:AmmeMemoRadiSam system radical SAM enzyme [Armatimonadota bacterium]MDW8121977.1 AmmeMemoRadiSam system radical SAM enzyme [Armatimonadota bacterium]